MDALQLDIGIVYLEGEIKSLVKVNVRTLNCVHILAGSLKLIEIEILRENFHFNN